MRGPEPCGRRSGWSGRHHVELVAFAAELLDERPHRVLDEVGVRDPAAVVADAGLELLILDHLLRLPLPILGGAAGRERAHPAHPEGAVAVADLDEAADVVLHPRPTHPDRAAVGHDAVLVLLEDLDVGEDLVPAAAVETGGVGAELVEDLLHLERGRERLDTSP